MTLFLTPDESRVYALIAGRDSSCPVPLATICAATGMSARQVKGIVEALRTEHRLAIGASRRRPNGYYECRTTQEIDQTIKPMFRQAINMLMAVRAVAGKQRLREWMGQARLY